MLGLEPLYLACEGRLVIMASKKEAEAIVETLKKCPYSANAAIIGGRRSWKSYHGDRDRYTGITSTAGRRAFT